jgi:hypothetical protein
LKLPGSIVNVHIAFSFLPQWVLFATPARAYTDYHHSRFYFLIPAKAPDLATRPDSFSGPGSEVAKRTQRGSKEDPKRKQRGGKEEAKRRQRGSKEEAKRRQRGEWDINH